MLHYENHRKPIAHVQQVKSSLLLLNKAQFQTRIVESDEPPKYTNYEHGILMVTRLSASCE